MKYYRPSPDSFDENPVINLITKYLRDNDWSPISFKYWRIMELYKNRKRCNIIQIHWPEAFWRSQNLFLCYLKALYFIYLFYVSKMIGYKWVFSAHNVIPHYKVKSPFLERVMRCFILRNFDLVIGLAYNTKNDLELAFGTSGKKYVLALHGTYEDSYPISKNRKEFRDELGIPEDAKVLLFINTLQRDNKGMDGLIKEWANIQDYGNVHLLMTGIKPVNYDELIKDSHFHFIAGYIENEIMGSLLNAVDFIFLNYKNITTSGMYFLSVTFNLPIIAPNLPFFKLHASDKTALFFDYNYPLSTQLTSIIDKINSGWKPSIGEFESLVKKYQTKNSVEKVSKAFNELTDGINV